MSALTSCSRTLSSLMIVSFMLSCDALSPMSERKKQSDESTTHVS